MPLYLYECKNTQCDQPIYEEYRHTDKRNDHSACPKCNERCERTYHGQTPQSRIHGGKKRAEVAHVKWEDIDDVPDQYTFTTEANGKVIDETEIDL